ncbi:MAG: hypothetical protein WCK28_09675 [Burkholderiales bacterium]
MVRCDRCDLERVDPMPSEAEVAAVYERGYFSGEGHGYCDYFGRERAVADAKAKAQRARPKAEPDPLAQPAPRRGDAAIRF